MYDYYYDLGWDAADDGEDPDCWDLPPHEQGWYAALTPPHPANQRSPF